MKTIEKLKLKKKILTSTIALSTLLSLAPITSTKVSANELNSYEHASDANVLWDIYYYSILYNIKKDIAIDIFKKETNDFSAVAWGEYNMVGYKLYKNKKEAIIDTIKNISENPEHYGYTKEEIVGEYNYCDTYSPELMVEKYAEIYDIPSEIPLAIMYSECGKEMDSHNYLVNNNPAGIGPNMRFPNKEVGIIYFIDLLKNKYGCDNKSNKEFFKLVAGTYCENTDHWISMTNSFYNNIKEEKVLVKEKTSK